MENLEESSKNNGGQANAESPSAASPAVTAEKKKGFSFKLFFKLIVISILVFSAIQVYSFDSSKENSGAGLGNIIKSVMPGNITNDASLSNSDIEGIIKSLVPKGTSIAIKEVAKEAGLYKLSISISGPNGSQDITGFLTVDGKKFFPQVIDVAEAQKQVAAADNTDSAPAQPKEIAKTNKPKVELFVMSHCPYGTQIEKGILPVTELLGSKIDFSIKFVDYAMHGQKEVYEQLNQYCIQKEQTAKYNSYLKCFLKDGNSEACLKSTGINDVKLKACASAADKEFKITEKFNDKSTWSNGQFAPFDIFKAENDQYGVQGSPTLVINGAVASSGRDSKSLLTAICSAFTEQPSECTKEISSAQPAPGFGFDASGSGASASCGN